jgi:hypothetical protein
MLDAAGKEVHRGKMNRPTPLGSRYVGYQLTMVRAGENAS